MSMNSDIIMALSTVNLPKQTGMYTGTPQPDGTIVHELNYIVLTPLGERNEDIADDKDLTETEEMDVNLYYVGNYLAVKNQIKTLLKSAGFFISDSNYIEVLKISDGVYQHHYVFTVEKKTIL